MAGTKIRGVTIEIGGDASGLSKALKGANSEIAATQRQLKDVEKLLKLDPGNTELLAQKQKLLGDRVEECKKKLENLHKAEAALKDSGVDQNSEQFMALQREIFSTEEYLKDATKELNNFSASAEKMKAGLDSVSEKAGLVAEKTKAISAAAAGAVAAIGGMAYKAMTAADDLNTLAQQSGLTTEEIQKFQYASDIVDVSTDDIISALKKMRKNMDSTSTETQEAWQRLGVSTTEANGQFRDSTTVFYEVLDALSKIPNETERDIVAMQLFGKNADQLAGIIDDGGQRLRELGQAAEENGLIWEQESIDAANAVNDMVDALKADISQTILVTGAKALEALKPTIEMVTNAVSTLLGWIGSLDADTLKLIITVGSIIALISPVAGLINKVTGAVSTMIDVMSSVGLLTSPWGQVALAIGAVITVITLLATHWDEVKEKIAAGIDKIKGAFEKLGEWVDKIKEKVKNFFDAAGQNMSNANARSNAQLPGFAGGGSLTSGSALVGEAGPEILTVGNGRATVTPLTNNNTTNVYNQTSTNPIQVNVQVDRQTIARAMYEPMQELQSQKGVSMVGAR